MQVQSFAPVQFGAESRQKKLKRLGEELYKRLEKIGIDYKNGLQGVGVGSSRRTQKAPLVIRIYVEHEAARQRVEAAVREMQKDKQAALNYQGEPVEAEIIGKIVAQ